MDTCKVEPLGATAKTKPIRTEDNPRPAFFSPEKNDAIQSTRKPRNVASKYMNGISSTVSTSNTPRRFSSPIASHSHTIPAPWVPMPKRSQSAERRRPGSPSSKISARPSPSRPSTPSSPSSRSATPVRDVVTEFHNTTRQLPNNKALDGLWPSIRSLSSSFQSESLAISVSKREKLVAKSSSVKSINSPSNVVSERKRTPLRGRNTSDQLENLTPRENSNTKVIDRHRWPSMMGGRLSANGSVDLSDKVSRSARRVASQRISSNKTDLTSSSASRHPQISLSNAAEQLFDDEGGRLEQNVKPVVNSSSQATMRSSSAKRSTSTQSSSIPSLWRPSSASTLSAVNPGLRHSSLSSTRSSIIPGLLRPSSPSNVLSTSSFTSRSMLSPLRTRASTPVSLSSNVTSTSSIFKCNSDWQRGKLGASDIEDAHQLKLRYSTSLQWRFINAQTNETLSIQRMGTENALRSVWNSISILRNSVLMKRIDVQRLQQEMKLGVILMGQMMSLEQWAALEKEHCSFLSGAIEALNTNILRLPMIEGAKADVIDTRNAVSSAVDMLHAIGPSIFHLLSKNVQSLYFPNLMLSQQKKNSCLKSAESY
ncbi:AUGMIN subunit 8-like isoform X2 [Curcuma longa]|uniref:AUGMIN subunit 8-like isoform X2 n=1 Tax=Curcuma longa TaxID=136217 RepID=UPI003D9DCA23